MTFEMPAVHHFKLKGDCTSHSRTVVRARAHELVIDEPEIRGGSDTGATPLETMLSSYLACLNVISHLIAREMEVELDDMSFALDATFDTRGFSSVEPTDLPFPELDLTVNVTTAADDAALEKLKADLSLRCPMTVVLTAAGTRINSTWNVSRP